MKKHLVSLWFDTPSGNYIFTGFVTTRIINPSKLFK